MTVGEKINSGTLRTFIHLEVPFGRTRVIRERVEVREIFL